MTCKAKEVKLPGRWQPMRSGSRYMKEQPSYSHSDVPVYALKRSVSMYICTPVTESGMPWRRRNA